MDQLGADPGGTERWDLHGWPKDHPILNPGFDDMT